MEKPSIFVEVFNGRYAKAFADDNKAAPYLKASSISPAVRKWKNFSPFCQP